jgi:hypothetical protein
MMAECPENSSNRDGVSMAPPDLPLITAALPSILRQRLASFQKSILLRGLESAYIAPKLSGDGTDNREPPPARNEVEDNQGQVKAVEDEMIRPNSSSSSSFVTPEPRTPIDYGMVAITKDATDSGVAWNRVAPGVYLVIFCGFSTAIAELLCSLRFQSPSEC